MSFLLDTDICSAHLKGDRGVWQKVMQYTGRLHVSAISVGELQAWGRRKHASPRLLPAIESFLQDCTVLAVGVDVGRKFGELRAARLDQGHAGNILDLFIAATALEHGLTMVTHNVADYANVPGLTIEDWLAP